MYHDYLFPSRRDVLAGGSALAALVAMPMRGAHAEDAYRLTALPANTRIKAEPARETAIWSYDGQVPGPVIRARQGRKLRIEFENKLEEPTTVHWHGLRIPNAMDGVPELTQPPVQARRAFCLRICAAGRRHVLVSPPFAVGRATRPRPLWRADRGRGEAAKGRSRSALGTGRLAVDGRWLDQRRLWPPARHQPRRPHGQHHHDQRPPARAGLRAAGRALAAEADQHGECPCLRTAL